MAALRPTKSSPTLGTSLGLRVIDEGALVNGGPVEGITALLATINRRYKLRMLGIRIRL